MLKKWRRRDDINRPSILTAVQVAARLTDIIALKAATRFFKHLCLTVLLYTKNEKMSIYLVKNKRIIHIIVSEIVLGVLRRNAISPYGRAFFYAIC